jgi:hypothetical protein
VESNGFPPGLAAHLRRLERDGPARRYRASSTDTRRWGLDILVRVLALSARSARPALDPANVILRRVPGVTTWPIRSTTHVVRGNADVFVLSPECAESWRHVVFGETLADTRARSTHIALFVRYGLIALGWRGAGTIRPVAAMCDPSRPLTPAPSTRRPVITINGATADGHIARSPLGAKPAECASALILQWCLRTPEKTSRGGQGRTVAGDIAVGADRRRPDPGKRVGVTTAAGDPVLVEGLGTLIPEHPHWRRSAAGSCVCPSTITTKTRRPGRDRPVRVGRPSREWRERSPSFAPRETWQETSGTWLPVADGRGIFDPELDEAGPVVQWWSLNLRPGPRSDSESVGRLLSKTTRWRGDRAPSGGRAGPARRG